MPSKSKKQAKLMRAVAHGWKPSRIKGPTRTVAKEFVSADKRRDKVTGYQFGGGVPSGMYGNMMNRFGGQYRGVPPQRGGIQQSPTGSMSRLRGRGGERGGYGHAGGVPGTIGGFGGYQGQGRSPFGGGADQGGALRQMMQRMQQQRGSAPGGGSVLSRFAQQANQRPGGGQRMYGRPPTPGLHDPQDMLMGEGPGGRLEQESIRRRAKMQGPGRFPGAGGPGGGALSQAGGKPTPSIPGRRIAPPPNRYPGGGNPNLRGRNPLMRAARNRTGRRGMLR